MSQSKRHSLIESVSNTAIGFVIAYMAQWFVYPWYGFHVDPITNLELVCIFTGIAIARNYCIRRFFNKPNK